MSKKDFKEPNLSCFFSTKSIERTFFVEINVKITKNCKHCFILILMAREENSDPKLTDNK